MGSLAAIAKEQSSPKAQPFALRFYDALIDTGASSTCITPKVVAQENLAPIGKCQMMSASHTVSVNQYAFVVALPMMVQQQATGLAAANLSTFDNITGLEFNGSGGTSYDVLIGMDIVRRGSLHLDFDGHFSFCF